MIHFYYIIIIMLTKRTAEHLHNIFCICIAVKYCSGLSLYQRHSSRIYLHLSKEFRFQYGRNGFSIIDQRKYCKGKEEEKCRNLL
jgi:hypothetical protein